MQAKSRAETLHELFRADVEGNVAVRRDLEKPRAVVSIPMSDEEFYMARKVGNGCTAGVYTNCLNIELCCPGSDDVGVREDVYGEGVVQRRAGKTGRDIRHDIRPEKGV